MLAWLRHGELKGRKLSEAGIRQCLELGRNLAVRTQAIESRKLYSSTAPRALQSSRYVLEGMCDKSSINRVADLWTGPDSPESSHFEFDTDALIQWIGTIHSSNVLCIVVTHFELCDETMEQIAAELNCTGKLPAQLGRGEGVFFDSLKRVLTHI